jgi:hypothetical protein
MFQSETLAWAIHADRIRDLERVARERRMLAASDDSRPAQRPVVTERATTSTGRPACGDSANAPA